jgi:hypothetical protein
MSKETRAATTRSSLRKELAAKTRSTRSSIKLNQLYLIQPGSFQKPAIKSIRPKDLLVAKVSYDMLVTYKQYGLTYFIDSLGRNRIGKCHGTNKEYQYIYKHGSYKSYCLEYDIIQFLV